MFSTNNFYAFLVLARTRTRARARARTLPPPPLTTTTTTTTTTRNYYPNKKCKNSRNVFDFAMICNQ